MSDNTRGVLYVVNKPNFVKVCIPTGRKGDEQILWLNNYLLKVLKIKGAAST